MPKETSCRCSQGNNGSCPQHKGQCGKSDGCAGGCCSSGCNNRVIYITEDEKAFLMKLAQIPFLPLARFVMTNSRSNTTTKEMAPVYLEDIKDRIEAITATSEILRSLADKHLITLDYDLPLTNGDYSMYEESEVYKQFCKNDATGGDYSYSPIIQRGSIALTSLGQDAVDSLE